MGLVPLSVQFFKSTCIVILVRPWCIQLATGCIPMPQGRELLCCSVPKAVVGCSFMNNSEMNLCVQMQEYEVIFCIFYIIFTAFSLILSRFLGVSFLVLQPGTGALISLLCHVFPEPISASRSKWEVGRQKEKAGWRGWWWLIYALGPQFFSSKRIFVFPLSFRYLSDISL